MIFQTWFAYSLLIAMVNASQSWAKKKGKKIAAAKTHNDLAFQNSFTRSYQ